MKKERINNSYYGDKDYCEEKIEKVVLLVKEQLDINLSSTTVFNIVSAFLDITYPITEHDIKNSMAFIKLVYQSLFGDTEGLDDFINSRKEFAYATYSRMRIRLAIFNHFGFLKETFTSKSQLLVSKFFNTITTTNIYTVLSSNEFINLDEFISYVESLTIFQREELRKIKVPAETIKELDNELMESLKALKKKNTFLKTMSNSKKK